MYTIYHAITSKIMAEKLISSATSISPMPDCQITVFLNGSHMPWILLKILLYGFYFFCAVAKLNSHAWDKARDDFKDGPKFK